MTYFKYNIINNKKSGSLDSFLSENLIYSLFDDNLSKKDFYVDEENDTVYDRMSDLQYSLTYNKTYNSWNIKYFLKEFKKNTKMDKECLCLMTSDNHKINDSDYSLLIGTNSDKQKSIFLGKILSIDNNLLIDNHHLSRRLMIITDAIQIVKDNEYQSCNINKDLFAEQIKDLKFLIKNNKFVFKGKRPNILE